MDLIEKVARAICEADKLAPDPDDPIYIRMRRAKAWEARVEMARAAIMAMGDHSSPAQSYPIQVGRIGSIGVIGSK